MGFISNPPDFKKKISKISKDNNVDFIVVPVVNLENLKFYFSSNAEAAETITMSTKLLNSEKGILAVKTENDYIFLEIGAVSEVVDGQDYFLLESKENDIKTGIYTINVAKKEGVHHYIVKDEIVGDRIFSQIAGKVLSLYKINK